MEDTLKVQNARYVSYDELLESSYQAYSDYLRQAKGGEGSRQGHRRDRRLRERMIPNDRTDPARSALMRKVRRRDTGPEMIGSTAPASGRLPIPAACGRPSGPPGHRVSRSPQGDLRPRLLLAPSRGMQANHDAQRPAGNSGWTSSPRTESGTPPRCRVSKRAGWEVVVVWECETEDPERLKNRLVAFLEDYRDTQSPRPDMIPPATPAA